MKEKTEVILMRIFVGEADKHNNKILYHQLIKLLHDEGIAGATILRGIAGFGVKSHMHTASLLAAAHNLPIIIEVVDTQENIDRVLPKIEPILEEGLITFEDVGAVRYTKD